VKNLYCEPKDKHRFPSPLVAADTRPAFRFAIPLLRSTAQPILEMTVAEARHNSNTSVWLKACDVAFEPRVACLRKALRAPSDFNRPSAASKKARPKSSLELFVPAAGGDRCCRQRLPS